MRCAGFVAILALFLSGGCATSRDADARDAALLAELRAETPEFPRADRRETKLFFSVRNVSRQQMQFDFPTSQHLEVTLRGPDGQQIFLWSEDRSFAPEGTAVLVNPGERLEFEAAVPTRDMVAGRVYLAEAMLPGHRDTLATVELRPR